MQTTISPAATRGTTSPISAMLTAMATTFAASLATASAFIGTHRTAIGGALFTLGLALATGADDELTLEVRGVRGAIRWNSMDPSYLDFYDNTLPEAPFGGMKGFTRIEAVQRYSAPGGKFLPPKNAIGWDRGHLHCYYTFLDAVAHGKASENGIAEGARLQVLMEKMMRSDREGVWVEV